MNEYPGEWHEHKGDRFIDSLRHIIKGLWLFFWSITAALYCLAAWMHKTIKQRFKRGR